MTATALFAFALAMLALSVTPGPGVAAVISRALGSGWRAGLGVATGIVLGDAIFLGIAVLGLSALAEIAGPFFAFVKYVGAAYLVWLGIRALRDKGHALDVRPVAEKRLRREVGLGLFVTLGNPKAILFYGAFVPTFIDMRAVTATDYGLLVSVVAGVCCVVLGAYAVLADRTRRLATSATAMRRLNRVTGVTLIGAGAVIATR